MSRNCHKSAYHGVFFSHLKAEYIYPQTIPEFGIQGGLSPEDVRRLLITHPETEAVLVVSPTYDGIVSDINAIAKIVHKWGIPLIVDEALMVEPTETESKETLDNVVDIFKEIYKNSVENPEAMHEAPHSTPVRRLDEVGAARNPVLKYSGWK